MADSASPESPGLTPQALLRDSSGTLTRPAGIDGLRLPGIRVLRSARLLRLAAMPSHAPPVLLSGDSLRLPPDSGTAGSDIAASLRSIWLHSGERLRSAPATQFRPFGDALALVALLLSGDRLLRPCLRTAGRRARTSSQGSTLLPLLRSGERRQRCLAFLLPQFQCAAFRPPLPPAVAA